MVARRAAHLSLAAASIALAAALLAFAEWSSGSPGPGLVVSIAFSLVGFGSAVVAESAGTDRHDLKLGLVGLTANLVIAAFWALVVVAALTGS